MEKLVFLLILPRKGCVQKTKLAIHHFENQVWLSQSDATDAAIIFQSIWSSIIPFLIKFKSNNYFDWYFVNINEITCLCDFMCMLSSSWSVFISEVTNSVMEKNKAASISQQLRFKVGERYHYIENKFLGSGLHDRRRSSRMYPINMLFISLC